jgi:hypothetical protein
MKRSNIILAALLTLTACAYGYNQRRASRDIRNIPKGQLLIEKLPEGAEGVVLEEGVVKAKPGYKFVKKGNKVMVMKVGAGGGLSLGGSWSCACNAGGEGCETFYDEGVILCRKVIGKDACAEKCVLSITIKGVKAQIIQY